MRKIGKIKRITPTKFREKEQEEKFDIEHEMVINALTVMGGGKNSQYRKSPYNLNDVNDLLDAIERTFCELMDIDHYYSELNIVDENYDETLELYEPKQWLYGSSNSNLYNKAIYCLGETITIFYELVRVKKDEFIFLIEKALHSPNKKISKFLFDYETIVITDVGIFIKCLEEVLLRIDEFYVYDLPSQKNKLKDFMYYVFEAYEEKINN